METEVDSLDPASVGNLDAAEAFAALGSEARLAILRALVRAGPGGLAVGAIQERVGLAPSTLSHHLRALTNAGVVVQRREGRVLNCLADFDRISGLAQFLISECCVDAACEPEKAEVE